MQDQWHGNVDAASSSVQPSVQTCKFWKLDPRLSGQQHLATAGTVMYVMHACMEQIGAYCMDDLFMVQAKNGVSLGLSDGGNMSYRAAILLTYHIHLHLRQEEGV